MGKQKRKKTNMPKSRSVNEIDWQAVAWDLYDRGLISIAALAPRSAPRERRRWS